MASERLFHIFFPFYAREIRILTAELSSLREQNASYLASIDRLTEERDRAQADAAEARKNENVTLQKLLSAERADAYRTDPFGFAPVSAPAANRPALPQVERVRERRSHDLARMNANLIPVTMWAEKPFQGQLNETQIEAYLKGGKPNGATDSAEQPGSTDDGG